MSATTGLSVPFYAIEEAQLIWATHGSCGIMIAFYPQVKRETVLEPGSAALKHGSSFPSAKTDWG